MTPAIGRNVGGENKYAKLERRLADQKKGRREGRRDGESISTASKLRKRKA